ncbi:MAG: hypothetical protein HZA19_01270 [Nitrospirae bacterium]|nr:hypothetical protein [Nitrospirota bacterium]
MKQKVLGILMAVFIFCGGAAWGGTTPPSVPGKPSVIPISFSCYDILTYTLQDCGVSLTLSEGDSAGGHAVGHDPGRPLGGLRFYGETGTGSSTISFRTNFSVRGIRYVAPEVSGTVKLAGRISPTPPYYCVSHCRPQETILVWVERLSKLLERTDLPYVVARGGTGTHPEGTYGTSKTLTRLQAIADAYFEFTDRKLSVNDLSLPWGGLFDINNNWLPPHQTHRFGTDADINRTDGGGVLTNCPDDKMLEQSIQETNRSLSGGKAALKCEPGGYKHVDFY